MEFNVVIPMWLSTGIVFLLAVSVLYHCVCCVYGLFFNPTQIPNYIKEYHDKPTNNGVPRLLRVLHYYHAFRYEYDIHSVRDIDTVIDVVHNRIRKHSSSSESFLYEIRRVHDTYKKL